MKSENDVDNNRNQHRPFWENACAVFMQRLIAYALRLANGRSYDADDLVQETFCRALTYPKDPRKVKNPLGYLSRIMRNIWITKWYKEHLADTESLNELQSTEAQARPHRPVEPAVEPDALRILENDELRARLRAQQGPLTPREELLLKLYLEGYNCKEIAEKLNQDVRLVRTDLNAMRTKVCSRLKRAKALKLP